MIRFRNMASLMRLMHLQVSTAWAWPEVGRSVGLPANVDKQELICRRKFKLARLDEFSEVSDSSIV